MDAKRPTVNYFPLFIGSYYVITNAVFIPKACLI